MHVVCVLISSIGSRGIAVACVAFRLCFLRATLTFSPDSLFRRSARLLGQSAPSPRLHGSQTILESWRRLKSARLTPITLQDKCVWPAYLKAHRPLFVDGDVECGRIDTSAIEGVELFEAKELSMDEIVDRACARIYEAVKGGQTNGQWKKP